MQDRAPYYYAVPSGRARIWVGPTLVEGEWRETNYPAHVQYVRWEGDARITRLLCECFSNEDAQLITDALNLKRALTNA